MGSKFLCHHRQGDGITAVLAAIGYNFRHPIKWLALLARSGSNCGASQPNIPFFTDNQNDETWQ
jgi:hypothetical protein